MVSVAKPDVSVLCNGLCWQVRRKWFVLLSSQMKVVRVVVSVAKSEVSVVSVAKPDVSVLCNGLCWQVRRKWFVLLSSQMKVR